jgi:uncharacterized RDD family membrane protein YckC
MSCPRCGDVCHCDSQSRSSDFSRGRPRFEVDTDQRGSSAVLVDPEAYDTSEEQFSASLETSPPKPKFVLDSRAVESQTTIQETGSAAADPLSNSRTLTPESNDSQAPTAERLSDSPARDVSCDADVLSVGPPSQEIALSPEAGDWKDEVAARLNSYRARRKPRPPKYPSLRLKFDPPETRRTIYERFDEPSVRAPEAAAPVPLRDNRATAPAELPVAEPAYVPPAETGRLIEFPRFWSEPPATDYALAEPVMDRPRIVEVPDITPPPPALGGINLPAEEKERERRPGFEVPLQSAPMTRRAVAMGLDGIIVLVACALFGYIVFKMAGDVRLSIPVAETAAAVLAIFWSGYQYLLLIYTGSTPGLRLAGLRLSQFDGNPVPRRIRRWRVFASILSAVSLGLGFAWSYLDEDALCWHDRITRTYLAPS